MMTNQHRGVDRAGRSHRFGRAIREQRCAAIRMGSQGRVTSAVLVLLVALALVGRDAPALGQTQEPAVANPAESAPDNQGLSMRYRFLERYVAEVDPRRPELLIQYQVGYRETVKVTREKPQGAPDQDHVSTQCIYTERVAKVLKGGFATDVVRRYDTVNLKTSLDMPLYKTKLLEGLTVLFRVKPRSLPQVVCLTPDRQLRQQEYILVAQAAFLPALAGILPRKPSRVGDTWPVPREAASALLGEEANDEDYDLTAEILEVHKNGSGPSMVAVIGVKGEVVVLEGPSRIGARLQFTFLPSEVTAPPRTGAEGEATREKAAGTPASPGGHGEAAIDARGYISKISMAQEISSPLPGNDGRFKQNIRRELVLERHVGQPGDLTALLLDIPNPDPVADVKNSWLIYDDPQGRFHLLHPQELHVAKTYPEGGIDLLDRRPDGRDVIQISLVAKTGDQGRDRLAADPIQVKKQLEDQWKQRGEKVVPGPSGELAKAEWSPFKREVYRIEAALIPEAAQAASGRIYLDHYIVKFARNEVLVVEAITTRESQLQFRDSAELIIKSFEFGPSASSLPAAPKRVPRNAATGVPTTPPLDVPKTQRPR